MKVYNSPSTLVAQILELEPSLEVRKKRHREIFDALIKEDLCIEEVLKTLQKENELISRTERIIRKRWTL